VLNAKIFTKDFEHMWKIQYKQFQKYLSYNIMCGYIVFSDGRGYGVLKHLISCLSVYALW
jgi:hypothetical protein